MSIAKREFESKKIGKDCWNKIAEFLEYWDNIWLRGMCSVEFKNPYISLLDFQITVEVRHVIDQEGKEMFQLSKSRKNKIIRMDIPTTDLDKLILGIAHKRFLNNRILWKCFRCNKYKLIRITQDEDNRLGYYVNEVDFKPKFRSWGQKLDMIIFEQADLCGCFLDDCMPKAIIRRVFHTIDMISSENVFVFPCTHIRWNKDTQMYENVVTSRRITTSNGEPIIVLDK